MSFAQFKYLPNASNYLVEQQPNVGNFGVLTSRTKYTRSAVFALGPALHSNSTPMSFTFESI